MVEIRFYHLQNKTEDQVLPVILSKALERGHKVVLKLPSAQAVAKYNDHLWTYSADSFLPHGSEKEGNAQDHPVWLTDKDENLNDADVLVVGSGAVTEMQGDFTLCCEMLNGHNDEEISAARARWKTYKEQDYDVTYWQETPNGGWEKKA